MKYLVSLCIFLLAPSVSPYSELRSEKVGTVTSTFYPSSLLGEFDNGYPKKKYKEVLDTFIKVYSPVIKKLGGTFSFISDWGDGAVNMWAWRWGADYVLEVPGGMSRYYLINEEAFVLSICHELGHLIGGKPQSGSISYEGQSDYFATLKCMKKIISQINPYKKVVSNRATVIFCKKQKILKQAECERTIAGALSLSSYYAKLEKVKFPKLSTPSSVVVGQTLAAHPPAQCRFDTFVSGVLAMPRPKCWFKP